MLFCMSARIATVNAQRKEMIEVGDLLAKMEHLTTLTEKQLDDAIEAKTKPADVARLIREARENVGMLGRFLGAFHGENATTLVDNRVQVMALKEMSLDDLKALTTALRSRAAS